jgi:hypothetical protein
MFKKSEDKYTRIHGMEKRRWLKCEILHQRGQGYGKEGMYNKRGIKKRPVLTRLTSYSRYSSDTTLSHPIFRRKPSA